MTDPHRLAHQNVPEEYSEQRTAALRAAIITKTLQSYPFRDETRPNLVLTSYVAHGTIAAFETKIKTLRAQRRLRRETERAHNNRSGIMT